MSEMEGKETIGGEGNLAKTDNRPSRPYYQQLKPTQLPPGSGQLRLSTEQQSDSNRNGHRRARFTTSLASYPLKILAPTALPSQPPNVALAYTLAYGGGLVASDVISLQVDVEAGAGLVLLTQGSTKVFKRRPGLRPLSHFRHGNAQTSAPTPSSTDDQTKQRMLVNLASDSFLLLLPDSLSPFKASKYLQSQQFVLPSDGSASVLILDWFNSGRGLRPGPTAKGSDVEASDSDLEDLELWSMDSYISTIEVLLSGKMIMRERMVLSNPPDTVSSTASTPRQQTSPVLTTMAKQLAPYNVYATVLIHGPHMVKLLTVLDEMCEQTQQFQIKEPLSLVWSYSEISTQGGRGGIVRLAALEVEECRNWMRDVFGRGGIPELVGEGVWPRVI